MSCVIATTEPSSESSLFSEAQNLISSSTHIAEASPHLSSSWSPKSPHVPKKGCVFVSGNSTDWEVSFVGEHRAFPTDGPRSPQLQSIPSIHYNNPIMPRLAEFGKLTWGHATAEIGTRALNSHQADVWVPYPVRKTMWICSTSGLCTDTLHISSLPNLVSFVWAPRLKTDYNSSRVGLPFCSLLF